MHRTHGKWKENPAGPHKLESKNAFEKCEPPWTVSAGCGSTAAPTAALSGGAAHFCSPFMAATFKSLCGKSPPETFVQTSPVAGGPKLASYKLLLGTAGPITACRKPRLKNAYCPELAVAPTRRTAASRRPKAPK